jgi:ketosteroid isomerase-like protein
MTWEETMQPNRRSVFSLPAIMLLGLTLLPCSALAQQSDVEAVKAAIESLHAALGSLDAQKMEPLWAHESYVTVINPADKTVSVGYDAVKKNWEDSFKRYTELKATEADGPHIHVNGNMAVSTGIAQAEAKFKNGNAFTGNVFETDVFEKQGGRWLLVSHSALRVPQ